MVQVTFVRVEPSGVPRLRAWLDALSSRGPELAESYRREHTRQEFFYLVDSTDPPLLVIVSESSNLRAGAREFLGSELAIDVEFKALIQEIRQDEQPMVELLFDSSRVVPAQDRD